MQKNDESVSIHSMAKISKNKSSNLVTQGILKSELLTLANKIDKKIDNRFNEERQKNTVFFASKHDLRDGLIDLKQELKTDINQNRTYLEKIVAKLEKKEQEDTMHSYQHKTAEDRLANHDKRLEKLEKITATV